MIYIRLYTQEKERKNKLYIIFISFINLLLQKSKIILTKMDDPFILWRNPHSAGMQTSREASDYKLEHLRRRASKGYKRPKASSFADYKRYRKLFWPDHLNPDTFKKDCIIATHINKKGKPVFPKEEKIIAKRPSSPWIKPPSPRAPIGNKASTLREELWIRKRRVINTNVNQKGFATASSPIGTNNNINISQRPQTTMPRPRKTNLKTKKRSYKNVLQREIVPFSPSFRIQNEPIVPGTLTGNSKMQMVLDEKAKCNSSIRSKQRPMTASSTVTVNSSTGKVQIPKLWIDRRYPLYVRHTKSSLLMKQRFSPRNTVGTTLRLGLSPRHHTQPSRQFSNW